MSKPFIDNFSVEHHDFLLNDVFGPPFSSAVFPPSRLLPAMTVFMPIPKNTLFDLLNNFDLLTHSVSS